MTRDAEVIKVDFECYAKAKAVNDSSNMAFIVCSSSKYDKHFKNLNHATEALKNEFKTGKRPITLSVRSKEGMSLGNLIELSI